MSNAQTKLDFREPPVVWVFGAGIAGLSAAHELVERGFKVNVLEQLESPTEEYSCRVGGMAANQLARVNADPREVQDLYKEDECEEDEPKSGGVTGSAIIPDLSFLDVESRSSMRPTQRSFPLTWRIRFQKGDGIDSAWLTYQDENGISNGEKLGLVLAILREAYAEYEKDQKSAARRLAFTADPQVPVIFNVRILGYTDTDGLPECNRLMSKGWAKLVADALVKLNAQTRGLKIPDLKNRLHPRGRGAAAPLGDQQECRNRKRSNRVEFQIVEQRLPGEHGYRFFPSYYRHLFDTMKRTPVFDAQGDLTHETAYDQLVSTPDVSYGFWDGEALIPVKVRGLTTLRDLRKTIEFFKTKAKFSDLDLLRLQTCFLKYMTSCKARRASEAEDASFWQYIGADRVKYSDAAQRFLDGAPQAFVAMSTKETDARTQYNAIIQLLVTNPLEELVPDMTLNASTSEAWLTRWKEYLRRKHVSFYMGTLKVFKNENGKFEPVVTGPPWMRGLRNIPIPEYDNTDFFDRRQGFVPKKLEDGGGDEVRGDFYVMALSFEEASKLVWDAWNGASPEDRDKRFTGPFRQLKDFDVVTQRRTPDGGPIRHPRDPVTGRRTNSQDPLRDISGIQYFMPANYRFGKGHVFYADSPWGLTSISQLAYWRNRVKPIGNYLLGQASFDIGNFHAPYPEAGWPTAWNSSPQEIAVKTWEQAKKAIVNRHADFLTLPQYYHLDHGLKFFEEELTKIGVKTTVGIRANAIVKINRDLWRPKRGTYRSTLEVVDKGTITMEFMPEEGSKTDVDGRNEPTQKLIENVNEREDIAAQRIDGDRVLISPVATTRHALITITGSSDGAFGILLQKKLFPANGMGNSREDVAKELFEAISRDPPQGLSVTRHGDTTIALSSTMQQLRNGTDHFTVAVFNKDNHIELLGSPRVHLALDTPIDPEFGPLWEISGEFGIIDNENAYIINFPEQWRHRPGILADEQGNFDICYGSKKDSLFSKWVPAGTYMATHTRLTTMEAANESGRHAVNAILQEILENGIPNRIAGPDLEPQLIGDFCDIWDPEDCEPPDLAPSKELDEALMREGLPHILDIFKAIEVIESLPNDASIAEALEGVRTLVEDQYRLATAAPPVGPDALESAIRNQMDVMRAILSGGVSSRGY